MKDFFQETNIIADNYQKFPPVQPGPIGLLYMSNYKYILSITKDYQKQKG